MPTLLAFDTTAGACSAAVWRDGVVLAEQSEVMARGHAEALVPMIGRVMAAAGLAFDDLDAVAAAAGPGAFTGIRIGLAAARGIALAAGIPAIGVGTLEALADGTGDGALLAVLDTKRGDLYVQLFVDGRARSEPAVLTAGAAAELAGDAARVTVAGDGADGVLKALEDAGKAVTVAGHATPRPSAIARIAAARLAAPGKIPAPEPLYLRPPEAKRPRHGGARRP